MEGRFHAACNSQRVTAHPDDDYHCCNVLKIDSVTTAWRHVERHRTSSEELHHRRLQKQQDSASRLINKLSEGPIRGKNTERKYQGKLPSLRSNRNNINKIWSDMAECHQGVDY